MQREDYVRPVTGGREVGDPRRGVWGFRLLLTAVFVALVVAMIALAVLLSAPQDPNVAGPLAVPGSGVRLVLR